MQQYGLPGLTEVIKNLIIINALCFLGMMVLDSSMGIDLNNILGLHRFNSEAFKPYQLFTHLFMHGSFAHIAFNMFALWMFGSQLEMMWGGKRFLTYYLLTGLGAAFLYLLINYIEVLPDLNTLNAFLSQPSLDNLHLLVGNHKFSVHPSLNYEIWKEFDIFKENLALYESDTSNTLALNNLVSFIHHYKTYFLNLSVAVGASGAIYGILLAFGMLFPNQTIYLYFAIPIKAIYMVIIFAAIELMMAFQNNPGDNVAHVAHLGGMIFGYIIIKLWYQKK